jgi:hypothetical protein
MLQGYHVYVVLLIVSLCLGFWNFTKMSLKYKWAIILLCFIFLTEIATSIATNLNFRNTPIYHYLIPIQFISYGFIFGISQKRIKLFLILFTAFMLLSFINSIWIQTIFVFPSYSLILLSLALVTTVLFDFKRLMTTPIKIKLTSLPDFWFNLGHLVFYSSTFFVFAFINSMVNINLTWTHDLIIIANLFLYSCYGLSLYLDSKITNEHTT